MPVASTFISATRSSDDHMFNYFLRRFLLIIPTFFISTFIVFVILQITPGGPFEQIMLQTKMQIMSGEAGGGSSNTQESINLPEESVAELKRYFNLDKPIPVRYAMWMGNVLQGDLGKSYKFSEPVVTVIKERLPISIFFGLTGFLLSYLICIPLGVWKAVKHGSPFDIISSALVFIGYSIPGFALGAVLLVTLGSAGYFPLGEFHSLEWDSLSLWGKILDQAHHAVLPITAYMVGSFATLTILMKNSLMENLGQDYVRTAFAKGLPEKRVVFIHAFRNSLIPIVTGLGHFIGLVFAGSFLIEKVFNIDGLGYVGFKAIVERDYTFVMGTLAIGIVVLLIGNILSDIFYALVDPRIRFK
ncbi:MAG: ABC transporter permease subunit [Candidatus Kapaibacterium sp.]